MLIPKICTSCSTAHTMAGIYECSRCKTEIGWERKPDWKFCPVCGKSFVLMNIEYRDREAERKVRTINYMRIKNDN